MAMKKTRVLKLVETPIVKWEETLESFLLWKKAEGRSERTIKDYGYHVRNFFKCYPDAVLIIWLLKIVNRKRSRAQIPHPQKAFHKKNIPRVIS